MSRSTRRAHLRLRLRLRLASSVKRTLRVAEQHPKQQRRLVPLSHQSLMRQGVLQAVRQAVRQGVRQGVGHAAAPASSRRGLQQPPLV